MSGLFANRGQNQGRSFAVFKAQQRAERRQFLDLFADCLADGGSVATCAARLGKGKAWGEAALREIRAGLGGQAI